MIYPVSYLLDQFLNMVFGFGAMGLTLVLLSVILHQFLPQRNGLVHRVSLPSIKLIYIGLAITSWSIWAAYSAPSCGISFKSLFSTILIWAVFLLWPAFNFSKIVSSNKISIAIILIAGVSLVAQYFGFGLLSNYWRFNKPSGLFTEPSHVAMYLLPILGYRLLRNPKDYLSLGLIVVIGVFFNSATFMVGILFVALIIGLKKYIYSSNKTQFLFICASILIFILTLIILGYVDISILTDRIYGILLAAYRADPAGIMNASAIVWLNGWSQAFDTLIVTSGFGLGFNQMGCGDFINIGRFSEHISLWTNGVVLNWNDGSFLASKLIAEFGLVGICITIFLLIKAFHAIFHFLMINEETNQDPRNDYVIPAVGGICILLLLFVRANGYFLESVVLDVALLFYVSNISSDTQMRANT